MTDEQIDAMQEGPELDAMIERIVGYESPIPPFRPRFSQDWNAAMLAAERFGLWDKDLFLKGNEIWGWTDCYLNHAGCAGNVEPKFSAPTGQLAICRAILRLANRR